MSEVTLYHNPRCSKSRQTLALLEDRGIEPEIIEYLKTPPDATAITGLLDKLAKGRKSVLGLLAAIRAKFILHSVGLVASLVA